MFLIPHILRWFCTIVGFCGQHKFFKAQTWGFIIFVKKRAIFWPFLGIFSKPSHFLPMKEHLLTKKWSEIQNYIYISFKWSKNDVKQTFLAPSKNYHAWTSAKINQVLEVCLSHLLTCFLWDSVFMNLAYAIFKRLFSEDRVSNFIFAR